MILLLGWCFTLVATPSYTALQAGKNPWIFTIFIGCVVMFAAIIGFVLIGYYADSKSNGLYAAAIASTTSSAFLLFTSLHLARLWDLIYPRRIEFVATIVLASISCIGFAANSILALSGIALFMFTPRAWRVMRTNVY